MRFVRLHPWRKSHELNSEPCLNTKPSIPRLLAVSTLPANLAKGAQQGTHKSKRTLKNCIINELTKASSGDVTSYAVGKKEELERIAASAR